MKITFIMPCIGRKKDTPYVRTWQMEPLAIAQLKTLTPESWNTEFFDDRIEEIDYTTKPDLVAITLETYTARRAYQIADKYRNIGIPVVMGGYHPTLMPEEAKEHCNSVIIGEAEGIWETVLEDFKNKNLQPFYENKIRPELKNIFPDRSIFKGKKYLPLTLIETGRGCYNRCNFCSIASFFKSTFQSRPPEDIVQEILETKAKTVFFIDDNIAADPKIAINLFNELKKINIHWVSQISINRADDDELLNLMAESGCMGVLIGFESLNPDNLKLMDKSFNTHIDDISRTLDKIRKKGITIYGTFLFGYDMDNRESFETTLEFAIKHRFFLTAFNHLVPFPGTPLYDKLEKENRLLYPKWWLSENYVFGDVAFQPKNFSPQELTDLCLIYREKFYGYHSIIKRASDFSANMGTFKNAFIFLTQNLMANREVKLKQGLPLGLIQ